MKKTTKLLLPLLSAGIAVCVALILVGRWSPRDRHPDSGYLALLNEAYAAVVTNYVEKPDSKKLVQSMVDGMLAALDPHSAYPPLNRTTRWRFRCRAVSGVSVSSWA